jgi:hypothetical protein
LKGIQQCTLKEDVFCEDKAKLDKSTQWADVRDKRTNQPMGRREAASPV